MDLEYGSRSPDKAEMIAKFEQLSRQATELRSHLSWLCQTASFTSSSPTAISTSDHESECPSPVQPRRRRNSSHTDFVPPSLPGASRRHVRASLSQPPDSQLSRVMTTGSIEGEDDLHSVIQQIKTVLTDLLNCDSVKHDHEWRTWTQARLMETEMDLREYRRRRSSVSVDEKTLQCISSHLERSPTRDFSARSCV